MRGKSIKKVFNNEIGNHRWQRTPPTEKRGRVHTSSITVTVLNKEDLDKKIIYLNPKDVQVKYTRASGKGGQNVNKVETVAVLTHIPTGITVRSDSQRQQAKNEKIGWELLTMKLQNIQNTKSTSELRDKRSTHTDRSDKRRTYRLQDGIVIDHITNKRVDSKQILKGRIELLH